MSKEYKGLVDNGNGTYTITKQFETWYKEEKVRDDRTPGLQMENKYENWTGKHPNGFPQDPKLDESWHPEPCDLKLQYSRNGEWVRVPINRNDNSGPGYKDYNIARLEKYVDTEGVMRKAICYKKDDKDMNIWFKFEELNNAYENWILPDPPYYYNTQRWNSKMRVEYNTEKEEETQQIPKINKKNMTWKKKENKKQNTSSGPTSQQERHSLDYEEDRRQDRRQEYRREDQHSYYKDQDYWERSNRKELSNMYDDPDNRRLGSGRGSVSYDDPREDPRDPGYHSSGSRPRPQREQRRDTSRDRYRDEYRDSSRDRNRNRRYSDRSNSRERGRNYGAERARRSGYGNSGRF